jgi:hypothetical protein
MTVHAARLERWLGAEKIASLQSQMVGWYGPPINLTDVPGSVWVTGDGDFIGDFGRGGFASALDHLRDHLKDFWHRVDHSRGMGQFAFGAGFTSISDALARASAGNSQMLHGGPISKTGPTATAGAANSLWRLGTSPSAGAAGSAAPGGRAPTDATAGAMVFNNPASGTLHLVGADFSASVVNNAVMLYDRIFDVAKTINSTATEAVTGVPTRYQSTTATDPDYIGGNFLFIEVGATPMAATAHNWTTCTYVDQANAASTLPIVTGVSGAIAERFDMPSNTWFCPLEAGDVGIKALTQMQCSAAVATGSNNFVIGHALGIMMMPIAGPLLPFDWLTNRNQAPRIFNDACPALFELPKPASTATTYSGQIYVTSAAP